MLKDRTSHGEQRKGLREVAAQPEEVYEALRRDALHYGARRNRLYIHGRGLIDLLLPGAQTDVSYALRAVHTENLIEFAISLLHPPDCKALRICLALESEARALQTLESRRQDAARLYGVAPNTFRLKHERALLFDLAFQVYSILIGAGPETPEYLIGIVPLQEGE
ncbi:hypothetical protein E1264_27565 [Actinomadura sp. KC216]|uniref:hypothetical protein n=1 Tax=Actinomadura sp. KC216 TaxID=2530370 RepID=UPI00104F1B05|nr:hypothetical protein [Actinomadura sp. KC216]TDB83643.1 hypothetical protein E1264_27565 [Actinomadura sp. KC216]